MIEIKNFLNFGVKYGLLITDTDVMLVSWKSGNLEQVALFSNDDDGIARFAAYKEKNSSRFHGKAFYVLANIIGEDYRLEKVAHLIGKYKTDFHKRRINQLFRGSNLALSLTQGREDRGRREDIVMFYGLLTENKVTPWVNSISKGDGGGYVVGVYSVPFIGTQILKSVLGLEWKQGNQLLMTIHEKGLFRQTFYSNGHIRFSRVSKINDESPQSIAEATRKELERTVQYLNSLKVSVSAGINIQFICPSNAVGQLKEMLPGGERIKFYFHDASSISQKMGLLSSGLGDLGRDSSLMLHSTFSFIRLNQLASAEKVRFYWIRQAVAVLAVVFIAYGLIGSTSAVLDFKSGVSLSQDNGELVSQRDKKSNRLRNELGAFGDPPSTPENIRAVSKTFNFLSNLSVSPSRLVYFFSRSLEKNKRIKINDLRWYVTDDANSVGNGNGQSLISGNDIFQVLEVSGEFLSVPGETYIDVANRADLLLESLEGRSDIAIQAVELPTRDIESDGLTGVLEEGVSVDAARSRIFRIRIIWKPYSKDVIDNILEEV